MMNTKRCISFLLTLVMLFSMLPLNVLAEETEEIVTSVTEAAQAAPAAETTEVTEPAEATEPPTEGSDAVPVTRAQWLQLLVNTFEYTIEEEVVPDNYFPDLSAEADYYNDVLIAVYYGLVDVLPNSDLRPDEAATREFAAHTLNACMGFMPTEVTYGFSESDTVTYPDDIQVAIERGWFVLVDGAFLPEQAITLAEQEVMLADAAEYVADMAIDGSHENAYTFKEGVIEITEEVKINLDAEGLTITIPNQNYSLKEGDKIVVYQGGLAVPYQVVSSTAVGFGTEVLVTDLYFDDAIDSMDVQLETDADPANFYAADDTELIFIEESTGAELTQQQMIDARLGGSTSVYIPKYEGKLQVTDIFSVKVSVELKNSKVVYDVDLKPLKGSGEAKVYLDTDGTLTASMNAAMKRFDGTSPIEAYIGGYNIPGVGGLSIYLKLDISGSIQVIQKFHMKLGVKVGINKLIPYKGPIFEVKDKGSALNAEVSAKLYLEAKFGLTGKALPIKGYLFGEVGLKANVRYKTYVDLDGSCVHFGGHLFAVVGARADFSLLGAEDSLIAEKEIYNEKNSPLKLSFHYEDGAKVSKCTREGEEVAEVSGDPSVIADSGYTTSSGSGYSGSGLTGGSSTGSSSSGEPAIIYEYSLDSDNNATITKYSGNATSLSIPITIDGYPVVAIGASAFSGCTGLRSVIIPDSVTYIAPLAFNKCSNLNSIQLPANLTSLGDMAFAYCTSLTYIKIPKTLTKVPNRSGFSYTGPFFECSNLRTITIENGMTAIPSYLFRNASELRSITIPDSVTSIGYESFAYASSLKEIQFSGNLTFIDDYAFWNCKALLSVELPDCLTYISPGAFSYCTALAEVKLPANLETLGDMAFESCTSLTSITIPKTVTSIPNRSGFSHLGVFYACTKLTTITLEEGMTAIPNYLLRYASAMETFVMPDSVTSIGYESFAYASSLKEIQFSGSLTFIDDYAFRNCTSLISIELPDCLTYISPGAFSYCTALAEVKLPARLETLGDMAFESCTSLTSITIPKTVTSVPNRSGLSHLGVFYACTKLTTITLEEGMTAIPNYLLRYASAMETFVMPDSVTSIGYESFAYASSLKEIQFSGNLTFIDDYAFRNCTSLISIELPDCLTYISPGAFSCCTALAEVKLPARLEALGDLAFESCTSLTSITIPKTVTNVPNRSGFSHIGPFYKCTALTIAVLEEGIASIPAYLFRYTPALVTVEIPASVKTIGFQAFGYATGLKEIVIPETVTTMKTEVFYGCSALETVTWSSSITSIPESTFSQCTALTTVNLPDNLIFIGNSAFYNCDGLVNFTMPDSVTSTGTYAFYDCDALTEIHLSEKLTGIANNAFQYCDLLPSIVLPDGLNTIGNSSFYGCSGLVSVQIPNSVTTISAYAFYNCDALPSITIPFGVTSINNNCFQDCDALTTVDMADSVTSLGSSAFYHCDLLKDVKLSRRLATIPSAAFRECAELEEIVIPYFATKIDANAFNSSPKLTKVVVHDRLATITASAFSYPDRTVFYGPTGSAAETWCTDNGYIFNENTVTANAVTVAQKEVSIAKGSTYLLDLDIDPEDFADSIVFKSGNTAVATVDETGKVTAVATGTAVIKIIVGDASASCKITVTQAVTKLTLDKTTLALDVPNTYQLTANITPTDATNQVLAWTSSNEEAATVDQNGLVTAKGNGTAVITATTTDGSNLSASCTVTVTDPTNIPVSGITLGQTSLHLEALETAQLTATIAPADAANNTLRWTSSDESVATVDQNGLVTALAKGTATITAAATDESGVTAACTVTVTNTAYVVTNEEQLESPHKYSASCTDFWLYSVSGAKELYVTFDERTNIEDGFDYLHIYDGDGNLVGTYTGTELAGQTITVPGDTVKIQLETDDSGNEWGFKVTDVKANTPVETIATGWSGATQWTLTSDNTLTFYGSGNMKDYGWAGGQPWAPYVDQITEVVIEEGVTRIGSGAFKDMTELESVTLPETGLNKIGIAAFYGCTSLKEINIPEGIYTIWEYTFKNCSGMESVKLPKTLIKIDQGAFEACTTLSELYLPTNVNIIGGWSFKGCTAMTRVDMQWADAKEIRPGAFKNCTALTEIILPSNIQILGDSCFYGIGATTFTVPDTVTAIVDWCFARSALKEIIFEGNAPAIGTGAFNKITLTAYYPSGNATWTSAIMQNYGGTVTWEAN